MNKRYITIIVGLIAAFSVKAENKLLSDSLNYVIEAQYSMSDGNTPLWLNANRYGIGSLNSNNGWLRAALSTEAPGKEKSNWGIGYGVDIYTLNNHHSKFFIQQAYVEGRWLNGKLTIGAKEQPMEMKNVKLSSGSQTLGINAHPVPQVRLELTDYIKVPLTKGWLNFKGHLSYGMMLDNSWKEEATNNESTYTEDALYHQKAGYLKLMKPGSETGLRWTVGLEMACMFGGTTHEFRKNKEPRIIKNDAGLSAFWHALYPNGGDKTDGEGYANNEGNHLGSWVTRLDYEAKDWTVGIYLDKFFEDHSQMFNLDFDGYDTGENYMNRKESKFFVYDFKDMLLGAELKLKRNAPIDNIVFEYIYTLYQSGPIYHDHTPLIPDHIAGNDDYYNHGLFASYSYYGQVMGNPLYRSPIYNASNDMYVQDSRYYGFHFAFSGHPAKALSYRILSTWQKGYGRYKEPFIAPQENISLMGEAICNFAQISSLANGNTFWKGLSLKASLGLDHGKLLGNNFGAQVTVSYRGVFDRLHK